MSTHSRIQHIKTQIIDTKRLLKMVHGHPLMAEGLNEKIEMLEEELMSIPNKLFEPALQLLFSGDAVSGSQGIKSTFISKIMPPIQGLVKVQLSVNKYGKVGRRGRAKKKANTELYLTALPKGSFGIELSQLNNDGNDLYEIVDASEAMKDVILLVKNTTESDEIFEAIIESTPKRSLNNLKTFLQEVANEKSILKMESGEIYIELSNEQVDMAARRVSSAVIEDEEIIISGIFRGLLLDSNKFDIQDEDGKIISGSISDDIDETQLIEYDQKFLNKECTIHLRINKIKFTTGNEKKEYELLDIKEKQDN